MTLDDSFIFFVILVGFLHLYNPRSEERTEMVFFFSYGLEFFKTKRITCPGGFADGFETFHHFRLCSRFRRGRNEPQPAGWPRFYKQFCWNTVLPISWQTVYGCSQVSMAPLHKPKMFTIWPLKKKKNQKTFATPDLFYGKQLGHFCFLRLSNLIEKLTTASLWVLQRASNGLSSLHVCALSHMTPHTHCIIIPISQRRRMKPRESK